MPDHVTARRQTFMLHSDARGYLLPIELDGLDFTPRRIFIVSGEPGALRGGHGPAEGIQLLIAINNPIRVAMRLEGAGQTHFIALAQPGEGLRLEAGDVAWQYFPGRAELLVVSDQPYCPKNYITPDRPLAESELGELTRS